MLRPYACYLRVYEPLSVFGDPPDRRLAHAIETNPLTRAHAGQRELWLWLKSQVGDPVRLLPAETISGDPSVSTYSDVLVLDPAEVPVQGGVEDAVEFGREPLVCPLEMRARSAASLRSLLGERNRVLRTAVLDAANASADDVRSRTSAALREPQALLGHGLHTRSSTWAVPLPWFTLIDPQQRRLVLGNSRTDPRRELSWRSTLPDARRRVTRARELLDSTVGDVGPAQVLADTEEWLGHFDPNSAVELDYGGLVQSMSDSVLQADDSDEQIQHILDALGAGDMAELTRLFNELQRYWAEIASHERLN